MAEEVQFEKRGFWDIFIERYTSRKLLILAVASLILGIGLAGWLPLTEEVFKLLEWWRGIAYVYMGVQAGVDAIATFRGSKGYTYVPQTTGVITRTDSPVPDKEELLSP